MYYSFALDYRGSLTSKPKGLADGRFSILAGPHFSQQKKDVGEVDKFYYTYDEIKNLHISNTNRKKLDKAKPGTFIMLNSGLSRNGPKYGLLVSSDEKVENIILIQKQSQDTAKKIKSLQNKLLKESETYNELIDMEKNLKDQKKEYKDFLTERGIIGSASTENDIIT